MSRTLLKIDVFISAFVQLITLLFNIKVLPQKMAKVVLKIAASKDEMSGLSAGVH